MLIGGTIKGVLDRNRGVVPGSARDVLGLAAIIFIRHFTALTGHGALQPSAAHNRLSEFGSTVRRAHLPNLLAKKLFSIVSWPILA
jgi:hypothetical protein